MKAILLSLLLLSVTVNCARDDFSVHPDDCGVALMQSFKDFTVEHSIKSTKENKINYVYFGVKIKNYGTVGAECMNEFSTEFSYDNVSHVNVTSGGAFKELTNTNVAKSYKIQVSALPTIEKGWKNHGGAKYSFVKFNILFLNKAKERIRHYTYLQYLVVDETTLAVNVEETRAETNVSKTEIIHDGDDCLKDGVKNIDKCVEEIELDTKLTCFLDQTYAEASKATKDSEIIVGDFLYCQMEFVDPTIERYIWITKVNVTTPDKRHKDVYPTGYYYRAQHNNQYTRFVVLVYWPEKYSNIAVTAKIKRIAECDDAECQECDGARNCYKCSGALKPQAKECVKECHLGWWEHKGNCKVCSDGCKHCKSPTLCQECDASKVLYAGACQATCPVGYHVKNRVCIKTPVVVAGKFENKDIAVYRDNCKLVYDKPWSHSTTNDEIRSVKGSCSAASLIVFGGTNPDDENQYLANAVESCQFALQEQPLERHKYATTRSKTNGVYWWWAKDYCVGYTKHPKVYVNACHPIQRSDDLLPEVQYHLVKTWVGYAVKKSQNTKMTKKIFICEP